jgi:hypothetical protein
MYKLLTTVLIVLMSVVSSKTIADDDNSNKFHMGYEIMKMSQNDMEYNPTVALVGDFAFIKSISIEVAISLPSKYNSKSYEMGNIQTGRLGLHYSYIISDKLAFGAEAGMMRTTLSNRIVKNPEWDNYILNNYTSTKAYFGVGVSYQMLELKLRKSGDINMFGVGVRYRF